MSVKKRKSKVVQPINQPSDLSIPASHGTFGANESTLVMDRREPVYRWEPDSDKLFKEPCKFKRVTSRL